jgi:hypothetical protein
MLEVIIKRAKEDWQINGIVPHLVDGGFSILRYADDTILFYGTHSDKTHKMKLLLSAFEQALDLKINFHKIK